MSRVLKKRVFPVMFNWIKLGSFLQRFSLSSTSYWSESLCFPLPQYLRLVDTFKAPFPPGLRRVQTAPRNAPPGSCARFPSRIFNLWCSRYRQDHLLLLSSAFTLPQRRHARCRQRCTPCKAGFLFFPDKLFLGPPDFSIWLTDFPSTRHVGSS